VTGQGPGASGPDAGAGSVDPFAIGARSDPDEPKLGLTAATLGSLDGIVWAVPSLALTVPGILLLLAVLAQIAAGASWLPVVRRKLGAFSPTPTRRQRPTNPSR
jgi:hypothetical protein